MSKLSVSNLTVSRGGKRVLDEVSLTVEAGKITALIGPNGGGKSSLVLALAGILPAEEGEVTLDGVSLLGKTPDFIRGAGIAAVPEGHRVLTTMTVNDNLLAAGFGLSKQDVKVSVGSVYETFPELVALRDQRAGQLSGGQQQMVALGQALVSRPKFILADEMSLGLAPLIVNRLMKVVADLAAQGTGVLLIEQFTAVALKLGSDANILSRGRLRYSGLPQPLLDDPDILHDAYLA